MRGTLGPADGNGEFLGVDLVNTRQSKRMNSSANGAVGRRRAGYPPANRIAQVPEIFF